MESNEYSDFRTRFIGRIFEPLGNYLIDRNITPGIIPLLGFLILLFFVFYKRSEGEKFTLYEKNVIFGSIVMFILTVLSQIVMITRPWER